MSLFHAREWWVYRSDSVNEADYDVGGLLTLPLPSGGITPCSVPLISNAALSTSDSSAGSSAPTGSLTSLSGTPTAAGAGSGGATPAAGSSSPALDGSTPVANDVIVTGSLRGVLRVWRPRNSVTAALAGGASASSASADMVSGVTNAEPDDLLCEENLRAPILQLASGRLSSASQQQCVAVLHPHKVAVYTIQPAPASNAAAAGKAAAAYYSLQKMYEHLFATSGPHFSAANMTCGPFGTQWSVNWNSATGVSTVAPSTGSEVFDSIAVQSMDGQLIVYERETFAFRRNLNATGDGEAGTAAASSVQPLTYLLPGPMVYCPRTDSFLIINSELKLDSFQYNSLASNVTGAGRSLRPEWSVNLGEQASHLACARTGAFSLVGRGGAASASGAAGAAVPGATRALSSAPSFIAGGGSGSGSTQAPVHSPVDVIIPGQRTLFMIKDSGPASTTGRVLAAHTVHSQRRLDFTVAALAAYAKAPVASASHAAALFPEYYAPKLGAPVGGTSPTHGLLLVSHDGTVYIYSGDVLMWSARLPESFYTNGVVPVAVSVARFAGVPGLITCLSSRGDVCVCYIGTEPPTGSLTGGEVVRDLDYAGMEKEHRALLGRIRELQAASASASSKGAAADGLRVVVQPNPRVHLPAGHAASGARARAGFDLKEDEGGATDGKEGDAAASAYRPAAAAVPTLHQVWDDADYETGEEAAFSAPGGAVGASAAGAGVSLASPTAAFGPLVADVTLQLSYKPTAADARAQAAFSASGEDAPQPPGAYDVQCVITSPAWACLPRALRTLTLYNIAADAPPVTLRLPFRASARVLPSDATAVTVQIKYTTASGETSVTSASFALPLALVCTAVPPLKSTTFKLTLEVNRDTPPLMSDLFADVLASTASVASPDTLARVHAMCASVISFAYATGADATILVSKSGGRFRVQSDTLPALTLVASMLTARLAAYYTAVEAEAGAASGLPPLSITYPDPLPLADFFQCMDSHLAARQTLARAVSELNDRAAEYRLVIKRLLVRWKDKSPPPLNALDKLAHWSHTQVLSCGARTAAALSSLAQQAHALSAATSLLQLLARLKFGLTPAASDVFAHVLTSHVSTSLECGWEEMVGANLTAVLSAHALKTGLASAASASISEAARAARADTAAASASPLVLPEDTQRLQKHIAMLGELLARSPPNMLAELFVPPASTSGSGSARGSSSTPLVSPPAAGAGVGSGAASGA